MELKNIKKYAMPMISSAYSLELDWYHALGCFYAVENGLVRGDLTTATSDFVFERLHSVRDAHVVAQLTSSIRQSLPDDTPKDMKDSLSSKSRCYYHTSCKRPSDI